MARPQGEAARSVAPLPEATERDVVSPLDLVAGTMLGGKYLIERELGRGGFGIVVRATHVALGRRVAIKVLTESENASPAEWAEDSERFRREAKATAALRSEHVVRVLDVDELPSGHPYIVMELLRGRTLHDVIYTQGKSIPVSEFVDVGVQVLAGLADAHAAGVVHRDLKPANIFLTSGAGGAPLVKVLDFGVSKISSGISQTLTATGAVVGTVAYMAPEQLRDARDVDGRADLWSLGIVLYEALAGMHPFGVVATNPKVVTATLEQPIVPLRKRRPDVPPGLEAVLSRLLEKSPERRFGSASEAAEALAQFATPNALRALEEIRRTKAFAASSAPRVAATRTRPKRLRAVALGAFVLVLASTAVWATRTGRMDPRARASQIVRWAKSISTRESR
jgi:serine/threonine protein kinase